jgi:carbohydrate kinase (thermoresistant glucokinase family)
MGVCGSGKTTVGERLAERLGVQFQDADEFHPSANVAKMSAGIPLTDEDRIPWLDAIGTAIRNADPARPFVVSCSALKRGYRDRIRTLAGRRVDFVFLTGPREILAARMNGRKGHFMPPSLLDSQLATLEPPTADEQPITVSIDQPVETIVDGVLGGLGAEGVRA